MSFVYSGYKSDKKGAQDRLLLLEHDLIEQLSNSEHHHEFFVAEFQHFFQKTSLKSPTRFSDFLRINLDFCSKTLKNSVCYFLDPNGLVLDSSNRQQASTFVGEHFKERIYFKEALEGKLGKMAAVGVATNLPGHYLSRPVYSGKKFQGVFVIKKNFLWSAPFTTDEKQALTDEFGIVLSSNHPELILKPIWPLSLNITSSLLEKKIYTQIGNSFFIKKSSFFWEKATAMKVFERKLKDYPLKFVILAPLQNTLFSFFLSLFIITIIIVISFFIIFWNSSLTRLREGMIFSDRMASVGKLAAGLAHEINNPLVVLKYNVTLFRQLPTHLLEGRLHLAVSKQDQAIDRISQIIRGLQEYTQMGADNIEAINVHEVVNTVMTLIAKVYAKEHIFIEKNLTASQFWIEANSAKLLQIIMSLVSFYKDLRVETDISRYVVIETLNTHDHLRIFIKEKKTSLHSSDLSKLFEPFFPISSLGRHSLGPYITYSLIKNLKGDIKVFIDEEKSLVFAITFPFIPFNELS